MTFTFIHLSHIPLGAYKALGRYGSLAAKVRWTVILSRNFAEIKAGPESDSLLWRWAGLCLGRVHGTYVDVRSMEWVAFSMARHGTWMFWRVQCTRSEDPARRSVPQASRTANSTICLLLHLLHIFSVLLCWLSCSGAAWSPSLVCVLCLLLLHYSLFGPNEKWVYLRLYNFPVCLPSQIYRAACFNPRRVLLFIDLCVKYNVSRDWR